MRLLDNKKRGLSALIALAASTALSACNMVSGPAPARAPAPAVNGPQADYPVVLGAPYEIGGVSYAPTDVLNYDEVGYLTLVEGDGITGAHHTLPLPSYVEVTSLESGRTILMRLEQRGPVETNHLIALAPAALAQLEAEENTPVRVRRVNPPEEQRALLRSDLAAPLRMETPMSLVSVLRRELPDAAPDLASPTQIAEAESTVEPTVLDLPVLPSLAVEAPNDVELSDFEEAFAEAEPEAEDEPLAVTEPAHLSADIDEAPAATEIPEAPAATPPPIEGGFVVQAAAFSTLERAERAAEALGGFVMPAGNLYRVRTGPFASRAQAEASLANVRDAGYSDARIYTND